MKLGALAEAAGIPLPAEAGGASVTGFAIDNRKVAPGTVFGAFQGATVNGEDFIPAAVQAGAVAVVARPEAVVEGAVHIADANPRRLFARGTRVTGLQEQPHRHRSQRHHGDHDQPRYRNLAHPRSA